MINDLQRLFDRCENVREMKLQSVSDFSASQLAFQPGVGEWSMLENLHHLVLTDEEIVRLASDPEAVAHQTEAFKREQSGVPFPVVWLIMRLGIRVPVPVESVIPSNHRSLSALIAQWRDARERMRAILEDVEDTRSPFAVHPVCGAFNSAQTLQFLLAHDGYHFRHMNRLRRDLLSSTLSGQRRL